MRVRVRVSVRVRAGVRQAREHRPQESPQQLVEHEEHDVKQRQRHHLRRARACVCECVSLCRRVPGRAASMSPPMRATGEPPCAHTMHSPCTRHAHAMHAPCTRHTRATHTPRTRHAHACAVRMPPARSGRRACTTCFPSSCAAGRPPPRATRGGGRPPSACRSARCPSGRDAPTKTWCPPTHLSPHAARSPAPRRLGAPSPAQTRLRRIWLQRAKPRVAAPTTPGCSPRRACAPPIWPASPALRLAQPAAIASSPPSCRREIAPPSG